MRHIITSYRVGRQIIDDNVALQYRVYSEFDFAMAGNADSGFDECMTIMNVLMRTVGVWPLENAVVWPTCKFLILMVPLVFLNIIPQTGKAIESREDFTLILEVLTNADINEFIAFTKTLTLWYYKVEMKELIVQIYKDWNTASAADQTKMWSNVRASRWILRIFTLMSFGTIIMYTAEYVANRESNIVYLNGTAFRPLYLRAYFPFETHESPVYELISIGQCVGATLGVFGFAAYDGFYVFSILHCSGQLYNLRHRMQNLVEEHKRTKISFIRCLKPVIQKHLDILAHADIIENSFNKAFLVQVFSLSIALCLQGYQFVKLYSEIEKGNDALLIFTIFFTVANLTSIFAYCAIAQIIRDESLSLFDGLRKMQWYKLPPKEAVIIVILLSRCMKPIELTVGKFSPLTLEYFAGVVKTAVGYLSVLLAVKEKVLD